MHRAFNGCFPSVLTCTNCRHESSNSAESTSLVLEPLAPRSAEQVIPLMDKLREYFASEKVEWKCDACGRANKAAGKKTTMTLGPQFLIINVARHKSLRNAWRKGAKVKNRLDYPERLQMPVAGSGGREQYELQSVVAHLGGTMASGHYVAYVRQPDETWARCDDTVVSTPLRAAGVCVGAVLTGAQISQVAWKTVATCDNNAYQACLLGYRKLAA